MRIPLFFVHNVHLTLHETPEFHNDTNTFHHLLFHLHRTETQSQETHLQFKFRETPGADELYDCNSETFEIQFTWSSLYNTIIHYVILHLVVESSYTKSCLQCLFLLCTYITGHTLIKCFNMSLLWLSKYSTLSKTMFIIHKLTYTGWPTVTWCTV